MGFVLFPNGKVLKTINGWGFRRYCQLGRVPIDRACTNIGDRQWLFLRVQILSGSKFVQLFCGE